MQAIVYVFVKPLLKTCYSNKQLSLGMLINENFLFVH